MQKSGEEEKKNNNVCYARIYWWWFNVAEKQPNNTHTTDIDSWRLLNCSSVVSVCVSVVNGWSVYVRLWACVCVIVVVYVFPIRRYSCQMAVYARRKTDFFVVAFSPSLSLKSNNQFSYFSFFFSFNVLVVLLLFHPDASAKTLLQAFMCDNHKKWHSFANYFRRTNANRKHMAICVNREKKSPNDTLMW